MKSSKCLSPNSRQKAMREVILLPDSHVFKEIPNQISFETFHVPAAPSTESVEVPWPNHGSLPELINPNIWMQPETEPADTLYKRGEKAVYRVR